MKKKTKGPTIYYKLGESSMIFAQIKTEKPSEAHGELGNGDGNIT